MLRDIKGSAGRWIDENNPDDLRGAVVDPDLIQLRRGILACAFGVRVTQKACWKNPHHPWNGNSLAFSQDSGSDLAQRRSHDFRCSHHALHGD